MSPLQIVAVDAAVWAGWSAVVDGPELTLLRAPEPLPGAALHTAITTR